jgi:hypothetical protein
MKLRAFNHELSSERITIERVFGMMVRRYGILWRPIEFDVKKVPTIFRVLCKLHNVCMDRFMRNNPTAARLGRALDSRGNEAPSFAGDVLENYDITKGLDDVGCQPSDEEVMDRLENRYSELASKRRGQYARRRQPKRDALVEELYQSGVRFDEAREDAWRDV